MQKAVHNDLPKLVAKAKKLPAQFLSAKRTGLFRVGQEMRTTAIRHARYKSGDLRRSIQASPGNPLAIQDHIVVGSSKPYARVQDQGGTIRPKNSAFLTIPIGNTKGRIGNYDGFFIRSKKGNLLFVQKSGSNGIKPLFVLKPSVTIKGKPYLSKAFKMMTTGRRAEQIFANELEKVIKL